MTNNSIFDPDPQRHWKRKNYDEEKLKALSPREQAELETDRDLDKSIEQLMCDVHEELHAPYRSGIENIASAQKRMVSMMGRVALSNALVVRQMLWLTWIIAIMTVVILLFTVLMWKQNRSPNDRLDEITYNHAVKIY